MIPAICRAYYFEQLDSVGVAKGFGLRPPLVRQILHRLTELDAKMQAGTDDARREEWGAPVKRPPVLTTDDNYWAQKQEEWKRQGIASPW